MSEPGTDWYGQRLTMGAAQGEANKAEAIERVTAGADAEWRNAALDAVKWLASVREEFTTDDVWPLLRAYSTSEPRAMGSVVQAMQRAGVIRPTGNWKMSDRPCCNRRPVRVWAPGE